MTPSCLLCGRPPLCPEPSLQTAPGIQGQGVHLDPGGAGWPWGSAELGFDLRSMLPTAQTSLPVLSHTEHRAS